MKERLEELDVLLNEDYQEFKTEVLIWAPSIDETAICELMNHRKEFREVVDEISKIMRWQFLTD